MNHEPLMNFLLGILVGMIIILPIVNYKWEHHNDIIKHECGQYNNTTGDFEWIKELPNE